MKLAAGLLVTVLAGAAVAAPAFKETLTKDQRDKIVKAIQDGLPKPDKAKTATCQAMLDEYNKDPAKTDKLFAGAQCFFDAGAIGAAVNMWQQFQRAERSDAKQKDVLRALGKAYERAAFFDRAADAYEQYAKQAVGAADAQELMTRAVCIYRQLGDTDKATRDTKYIQGAFRVKTAPDALCDTIRPIAMPAAAAP